MRAFEAIHRWIEPRLAEHDCYEGEFPCAEYRTLRALDELVLRHGETDEAEVFDHGGGDVFTYCTECGANVDDDDCMAMIAILPILGIPYPDEDDN